MFASVPFSFVVALLFVLLSLTHRFWIITSLDYTRSVDVASIIDSVVGVSPSTWYHTFKLIKSIALRLDVRTYETHVDFMTYQKD